MLEKRLCSAILLLHILLGLSYAIVTPVFEGGDELWHYPMVRHLADGNPLPVQVFDAALAGPWKQQASQPPLYYYLGAALTFWIDTSDVEQVRRLNPHVDNGIVTVDGNRNLVVHDPALNPWQGTLLAVRVVRVFSVLLGTATVYLTYLIGRKAAPDRPEIALGAMALHAFLPMFLFIGGAVNNDNLIMLLSALTLWLLIATVVADGDAVPWRLVVATGVTVGLAALAKIGGVLLLPLAAGALFLRTWRTSDGTVTVRNLGRVFGRTALTWLPLAGLSVAIAGWWYVRNVRLYGDWRGWNAFIAVLGQRSHPASLAQLWDERAGFMQAFWGLFGGVNVPLWPWAYDVLNGLLFVAVIGFVTYALRLLLASPLRRAGRGLAGFVAALFDTAAANAAVVICLVWTVVIVAGLIDWATTTWSSQGRLVFSALSAEMVLLALGLTGWLPRRAGQALLTASAIFLFAVAAVAPWAIIRPAYQWQPPTVEGIVREQDVTFGDAIRLNRATLSATTLQPGDTLDVALEWLMVAPLPEDWSVFVHLNDPIIGTPIAQRDMYHGQGLRPTSLLRPGDLMPNRYRLTLPDTATTPATLALVTGLYNYKTGERLLTNQGDDAVEVATVTLEPRDGAYPNTTSVNFGDRFALVGYELDTRQAGAGDTLLLTLYVEPTAPIGDDYTFFAQIVSADVADTTRWAAVDVPQPTRGWAPGGVQTLLLPLAVDGATPPTVYDIIVGVYTQSEGAFDNLPLVTADGRITNDTFLRLTKVRIDGR